MRLSNSQPLTTKPNLSLEGGAFKPFAVGEGSLAEGGALQHGYRSSVSDPLQLTGGGPGTSGQTPGCLWPTK